MATRKKKKKNVVVIHEKILAIKHYFSWALFIVICSIALFLLGLALYIVFGMTDYYHDRGTAIVIVSVIGLIFYTCFGIYFYLNRSTPRWVISFDTKFKFFKIYKNRQYHIVRPKYVKKIKARTKMITNRGGVNKSIGTVEVKTMEFVTGKPKPVLKTYKVFTPEPKVVKSLMEQCIEIAKKYEIELALQEEQAKKKAQAKQAIIDRNKANEVKREVNDTNSFMNKAIKHGVTEDIKEDLDSANDAQKVADVVDKYKGKLK